MAVSEKLLALLVCPKCKGELELSADGVSLDCGSCKLRFRIEDDIPVMLIDEAQALE